MPSQLLPKASCAGTRNGAHRLELVSSHDPVGTYTLSTSSGLPSFFLSEYLSSRYGIILQMRICVAQTGVTHDTRSHQVQGCTASHYPLCACKRACESDIISEEHTHVARKQSKVMLNLLVTVVQPLPALQLRSKGDLLLWRDFLDPAYFIL